MIDFVKAKRHYIMALAIMFVVVSLSGTTYSLFFNVDSTDNFTYNTGILDLQFVEDEQINIQNAFPIIDSEGLNSTPYTLTIKNTGSLPYLFDIKMLSTTEDNVIDMKYIKIQVNNDDAATLYEKSNIIASNIILYPEEEKTFKVKVWLDINTPNAELGKTFMAKLVTSGEAIYKTLDTSGANHPDLTDDMIPVYYDETTKEWKKADHSNTINTYEWYNYDNGKWANVVTIKSGNKKIYDITRNNNLNITETRNNNGNYISDESSLDIGLSNYNYNNISNIFRIKFNDLNEDNTYIISNGKISYYYNNKTNKFTLKVGNNTVESSTYQLEVGKWYILGYTYDTNKVSFYIDGKNISTKNISGSIYSNNSFKIATDNDQTIISNLEVGDIYIYKNILTEENINNNYKNEINIIYNNLVAGYNDFEPKTLSEYYDGEDFGSTILLDDINSFYVWIPRYKYKLWNVTGTPGIDSYDAYNKGIDIIFENNQETSGVIKCQNNICYSDNLLITKVTNNDNGKYYTHPAFTTEEKELTGIWVSKYETSTSSKDCNSESTSGCLSNNLQIESKPNNTAWRNNYLSYFYQNIKKFDTNDNNYSVIKNTEWGALSYLTHSKYGLCQNNKCENIGTNKTYISGTEIKDSTTNNMYGIFDLSGSATEFVMANYADEFNNLTLNESHFGSTPIINNDYDLYQKNTFILGDATKEISLKEGIWYNNYASFVNETNNWFIRGGIGVTENNGIFYYNGTTDTNSEYITTRIVIK
ncbi:MAG: hypothetical protein IJE89_00460 [Bacilli bacterium]|nr:hypothetical protein [Bacilli bacterium]